MAAFGIQWLAATDPKPIIATAYLDLRLHVGLAGTKRDYREARGHRTVQMLKSAAIKLVGAISLMVLSVVCLRFTHNDFFFLSFTLGFVFSIMYWMDVGGHLRDLENPSQWQRVLGIAFGVPQALLGATSIGIGLAIIGWVLYNSLIERTSEYSGGFLALGIGPLLISAGAFWLVLAFKRDHSVPANDTEDL